MYNMYKFYLTVGIQLNDSAITDTDAQAVGVWFVSSPMNVWNETFTPDVRTISWLEDLTDQLQHQLDEYLQTRQEHDILPCSGFLCSVFLDVCLFHVLLCLCLPVCQCEWVLSLFSVTSCLIVEVIAFVAHLVFLFLSLFLTHLCYYLSGPNCVYLFLVIFLACLCVFLSF